MSRFPVPDNVDATIQRRVIRGGTHLRELASILLRYRSLIWHLTRREFSERYAGQVMGLAWIVAHPLFLMLVYIVAFAYVIRVRLGDLPTPMDYTVYMLSGLVPWLASIECINRATQSITANPGFVRQMTFPVEVLPARAVTATLPALIVSTAVLLLYSLIHSGTVLWTYALWPLVVTLHLALLLGLSYGIAALGVYLRDIKDLVGLYAAAGFFVAPILYTPEMLPEALRFVLYLNPASYLVWVYQDVFYFGAIAHPLSWVLLTIAAPASLYFGYRLFASLRPWFGESV
jgi:lipopolysaccharide transport system permease protein